MANAGTDTDAAPSVPDLELANLRFRCLQYNDDAARKLLMDELKKENMSVFYEECCKELKWPIDDVLISKMKEENEKKIQELDNAIVDAEQNFGESELRDALFQKIDYLCKVIDFKKALKEIRRTEEKATTLSKKLDLLIYELRIYLFKLNDANLLKQTLERAKTLLEESGGGDWDRRNRLRVYEGLIAFCTQRDFKTAITFFLDTLSTFSSNEVMSYNRFIIYTVLIGMISVDRPTIRDRIINNSEVKQVLFSETLIREFLESLFYCRYNIFFKRLADIEQMLKQDRYWFPHYRFYVRELRVLAYSQYLESYSSLSLAAFADDFSVTKEFIDKEIARFIASGRLNCKIDKVDEIILAAAPDEKNYLYQEVIKKGDLLLNRMQKLSRVINL